ncbi:hypothetical protein VTO73DRAFT_4133 [Trametes versicolor]
MQGKRLYWGGFDVLVGEAGASSATPVFGVRFAALGPCSLRLRSDIPTQLHRPLRVSRTTKLFSHLRLLCICHGRYGLPYWEIGPRCRHEHTTFWYTIYRADDESGIINLHTSPWAGTAPELASVSGHLLRDGELGLRPCGKYER